MEILFDLVKLQAVNHFDLLSSIYYLLPVLSRVHYMKINLEGTRFTLPIDITCSIFIYLLVARKIVPISTVFATSEVPPALKARR